MNITIVATFPNPNLENSLKGGYRRITELLKLLSYKSKYQIKLFVISQNKYDIKLDYCNSIHFIFSRITILRMIKTFFTLLFNKKSSDITILYNPTYLTFPALLLKYFGFKVIIDYVDLQGTILAGRKKFLRKYIEKVMISKCDYFITSSSFLQEKILLHNPNSKILMHRGVFYLPKDLNVPKKKEEIVNIMYLGLLSPISGIDLLIKAYDALVNKNTRLYIVGHGPIKEDLIKLAGALGNKSITFKSLSDEELYPFMLNMDILTIPYIRNKRNLANFPSKIIEYLWCGKAVLATDVGEIRKVLENNKNAIIVGDNANDIKNGLEKLIDNKEFRKVIGKNAREYFNDNFSPLVARKNINNFFYDVLVD